MTDVLWSQAWRAALFGRDGFYVQAAPAEHFRTSVTASPLFAVAVRRLAGRVDDALGRPDPFDLVDLGAGRGELLHGLPDVPARWQLTAVEHAPDPGGGLRWRAQIPEVTGLLIANEWLDTVPLDVVAGGRQQLVASDGRTRWGPLVTPEQLAWCRRWWPTGIAEVGVSRDRALAAAVGRVRRGLAVAVDYGHLLADRRPTLTGYRAGRQVPPVPDGRCDITAHVALDSCAAAVGARLLTQRVALHALGLDGRLPAYDDPSVQHDPTADHDPTAHHDHDSTAHHAPTSYVTRLRDATQAATLLDPGGLGGFGWLVREVGIGPVLPGAPVPAARMAR